MWQLTPGQSLVARQWDEDLVVYNALSGATHRLGLGAAVLLGVLEDGPASEATLAVALQTEFSLDDGEVDAELPAMLDRLSRLELIQPCSCSTA